MDKPKRKYVCLCHNCKRRYYPTNGKYVCPFCGYDGRKHRDKHRNENNKDIDKVISILEESLDFLSDMHEEDDGCIFYGGAGCLSCMTQNKISKAIYILSEIDIV